MTRLLSTIQEARQELGLSCGQVAGEFGAVWFAAVVLLAWAAVL